MANFFKLLINGLVSKVNVLDSGKFALLLLS